MVWASKRRPWSKTNFVIARWNEPLFLRLSLWRPPRWSTSKKIEYYYQIFTKKWSRNYFRTQNLKKATDERLVQYIARIFKILLLLLLLQLPEIWYCYCILLLLAIFIAQYIAQQYIDLYPWTWLLWLYLRSHMLVIK